MLEDMLAEAILQGTWTAGDTIVVDVVEGKLAMQVLASVQSDGKVKEGRQDAA